MSFSYKRDGRSCCRAARFQAGIGLCKDVRSFTSVLEQLELETNDHPELRTSDAQTDCFNDSEQEDAVPVFKTREISTFQLVVQGPEILNFQVRHELRLSPAFDA